MRTTGENERHVDAKSAMQRREERRLKIMGGMARRRPSALAPPTDSAGGVKGHRAIAYYTNARTSQRNARRSCAWTRNDRAGRYKIPMAPLVVHHRLRRKSLAREVRKGNLPSAVATPPPRPNPPVIIIHSGVMPIEHFRNFIALEPAHTAILAMRDQTRHARKSRTTQLGTLTYCPECWSWPWR